MEEERVHGWFQGALAVIVVGTACVIAVVSISRGQSVTEIPAWLAGAIGVILGFFYGQNGAQRFRQGVATATNGMLDGARKIAQSVVTGNGAEDGRSTS